MIDERRQFRVLYGNFVSRLVDPELLAHGGEMSNLSAQLAAILLAFSFVYALVRIPQLALSTLPRRTFLVACWREQEFLISTTMLVASLVAVLAWNTAVPDRLDSLILGPLPLRIRTMLFAKLAAVGAALGGSLLVINLFTGMSYPFLVIPPGGNAAMSIAAYWVVVVAAGLFVCCSILSIRNAAALFFGYRLFLRISTFLQLAVFFLVLAVYFVRPQLATPQGLAAPEHRWLLHSIPTFWFLGLFQQLNGSTHPAFGPLASRAAWGLALALALFTATYPLCFRRNMRRIIEQPDLAPPAGHHASTRIAAFLARTFLAKPFERAILLFIARSIARSRQHRLLLAAYAGVGLAIALAYSRSFLYPEASWHWYEPNVPLLVAGFILLFFAVIGLRAIFALPVALPANWVFRVTAVYSPAAWFRAIRKSLFALTVLPLCAVSAVVYLVIWPGRPALEHLALLILFGVLLVHTSLYRFRKMPFACSWLPGRSNLNVRLGFYGLVFLFAADVGVRVEFWALRQPGRYLLLFALLLTAAIWARRRTIDYGAAPHNRVQFDDAPRSETQVLDLRGDGAWLSDQAYVDAIDPNPGRTWRTRIARLLIGALVLAACGFVYEQAGQWRDRTRFPQVGRSIDVGGRSLNIFCSGEGSPTVILESGYAMPGYSWVHVQREIAKFTRACWYDRAGRGWSDPGPDRFYADSVARDLHKLLRAARVPPPYVLVGHSMGGLYIRVYTGFYPAEVAGLVFVDPTHEDLPHERSPSEFMRRLRLALTGTFGRMGLFRLMAEFPETPPKGLTGDETACISTLEWRYQNQVANVKGLPVGPSAEQARAAGGIESLPLIVLSAETTAEGVSADYEQTRIEILEKLARRSTRGRQVVVPNSSHMIPFDAPDTITGAVREIVTEARSGVPVYSN